MGIFDRISRLVRANVNDLVDRAENPELMLDQILRDMQSNIGMARQQVVAMVAQQKELEADRDQARRLAGEWGGKAQAAVAAGKDDLAREALRRKRDNEQNAAAYDQQLQSQAQVVTKLKGQMRLLEQKYQATLGQRDNLIQRKRRADAQRRVAETISTFSPLDPTADLERIERRIRGQEARAAALGETATDSWDAQFLQLDDPGIEIELAALKSGAQPTVAGGADLPRLSSELESFDDFDIDQDLKALKEGRQA